MSPEAEPLLSPFRMTPTWTEARSTYLIAAALAALTFVWPLLLWGDVVNFNENGPVEGPQSIYLCAATLLFLWALKRPEPLTRLELSGIALFTFNLLIRETDVRGTWAEPYLGGLFLHGREFFFLAGLWITVVGMVIPRLRTTTLDLIRWLQTPAGVAMLAGCLLYVIADRAEKHWFFHDADRSGSLEETLELYGCCCIFLSGLLTVTASRIRGRRSARNDPATGH